MPDAPAAPAAPSRKLLFAFVVAALAAVAFAVMWLFGNISERKAEAKASFVRLAEMTEETVDPSVWGRNFPRQYDSYRRTVDVERTKHGGSEAFQKLDDDPRWKELFKGYAFGVDYREERGHAYMLSDQDMTERVKNFKQPGSCLHCHASVVPAYRKKGVEAGAPAGPEHAREQLMKGFEVVCAMPYGEARKLVDHPITCLDCHDPATMALRVTRPGFLDGIAAFAASDDAAHHMPSVERWRKGSRAQPYDPNESASRQEMRSFVCGQCHVEYYFAGEKKRVTYPWHKGLKAEQIEAYYDEVGWKDWKHGISGAATLKAQHPEFETWSQGIHARSGVSCADCHMPYKREGAMKVSDHHVRSPLLNAARACQVCHHETDEEMKTRVETIQDRTRALMTRAEDATLDLVHEIEAAAKDGTSEADLAKPRAMHRKAQWRLDFVAAENSMGFHAPQETARILGEAIDYARQGHADAIRARAAKR